MALIVDMVIFEAAVGLVDDQLFVFDAPGEAVPHSGTISIDLELRLAAG